MSADINAGGVHITVIKADLLKSDKHLWLWIASSALLLRLELRSGAVRLLQACMLLTATIYISAILITIVTKCQDAWSGVEHAQIE